MMTRRIFAGPALVASLLASLSAAPAPAVAAGFKTYIAVGDSMAFGETDFGHNPSYGDRGYVKPFADYLATQDFDRRPIVVNLGVDAETTNTFFHGGPNGDGTLSGFPAPQLNPNFPDTSTTQNSLLLSTIASEKAAGHDIANVSVQLGANDLLQAVNTPGFFAMTPAQQQSLVAQALGNVQVNLTNLMSELHSQLPQANVVVLGYHNPFAANPSSPIAQVADPAIHGLNAVIAGTASAFGAHYVDTYSPFVGHEADLTYITSGNVHPNAAGYAAIAGQMIQTVPEPGSLAVLAMGAAGLVLHGRRRRPAAA